MLIEIVGHLARRAQEADPFPFAAMGLICLIPLAILALFIALAIWVYRDAEKRGMSGALWLIVVLVGGLIGLIIYLIVRKDHPMGIVPGYPGWQQPPPICPYCGGWLTIDPRFNRWYCQRCRRLI